MRASLKLKLAALRYLVTKPVSGMCYYVGCTRKLPQQEAELMRLFSQCGLSRNYPFNKDGSDYADECGKRLRNPLRRKFIFRLLTDRLSKYKAA